MSTAASLPAPGTPLSSLAVFDTCPPERLEAIDPPPEELEVQPGESIVREGHLDHEWYVILDGEAAVSTMGQVLGVLGPGEHFGEIAILSREPRRFTVRALTPMRVLMLTEEAFLRLLEDCGPFGRTLLVRLSRRMTSMGGPEHQQEPVLDPFANDRVGTAHVSNHS
jgi:CRP-like cAMP-binding protein